LHAVTTIGLISDTHGFVPEAALEAFEGVGRILHAGDVGSEDVLSLLGTVAPVTAVAGNMDRTGPTSRLPALVTADIAGVRFRVLHIERDASCKDAAREGVHVLVTGHTHRPHVEVRGHVLCVNPGSASRGASGDGDSVALLDVGAGRVEARIITL
jgi:hypothetical protein